MIEKPYESLTGLTIRLLVTVSKTIQELEPSDLVAQLINTLNELKWVEVRATCTVYVWESPGIILNSVAPAGLLARYPILETQNEYYRIGKDAWITSSPRYVRICKMVD